MNNTSSKNKTNRIQDPGYINYAKNILETAVQQCQQTSLSSPEVYVATAQRISDYYSAQNNYVPVNFEMKNQRIRGQVDPVPEITATIGNETSTSYFLVKDSLPRDVKATMEQLTYLRPDVVSARISANLGITQPTQNHQVPPQNHPASTPAAAASVSPLTAPVQFVSEVTSSLNNSTESKAEMIAQLSQSQTHPPAPVPPAPVPPAPVPPNLSQSILTESQTITTSVNQNPYVLEKAKLISAPDLSKANPQPIYSPEKATLTKNINQKLNTTGDLHQNIGKVLKDMAKGEVNPIQLYGETLNIIGNFVNGIPKGIHEARLNNIAQQLKLVESKRVFVDRKMDLVGDNFTASNNKPYVPKTDIPDTAASESESQTNVTPFPANPTSESYTKSQPEPEVAAIDELLKSNASLDDKLAAIEKTLDKMLEELIKIEKNLEVIQASLESNPQAPQSNLEDTVVETEVKTEVEVVANNPMAEVPVRTEIETDVIAFAKTETEANREIEVPEIVVDSASDIDRAIANVISEYEGSLDHLNSELKAHKLQIDLSEDKQSLTVLETVSGSGLSSPIFKAEIDGKDWQVHSEVNDKVKIGILNSLVEAEGAVLANARNLVDDKAQSEKSVKEEEVSLDL